MVNPVFEAKITGVTVGQQISEMNASRIRQNELAKSGGGSVTVPQFQTSGLSAGTGPNANISALAQQHLQLKAQGQYNNCVGKDANTCTGGSRKRKRKSRRRRSRKYKVKYNHKN